MNNYTDFELNEYGLLVFKHKTNKKLFSCGHNRKNCY